MNIIKPNLQWRQDPVPWDKNKYTAIALHHMAHPTWTIQDVHQAHIAKGWRGIGYGFWVSLSGLVYIGRGFGLNAGVEEQNGHIISIGFQGDYSKNRIMPDAQFNAGADIINCVKQNCPNVTTIGGHRDFMPTICPGNFFPLGEMKTLKKRGAQMEDLTWKDIIRKVADSPDEWEKGIETAVNAAKADGKLGDLEIFKYLPELIEKVYGVRP